MRPNASGTLVIVTSYLLGAQGIEAKIDETSQTEAYYKIDPTTGARLLDSSGNPVIAYRGVTSWYIYDGHGNVVGTVNGVTSAYTANPTLDVYGIPRASGTASTKQGYCGSLGHVTDDTGLVYMRARYYDPNVGRFVSEDHSCNGVNWYIYAGDNPSTKADKDGKNPGDILMLGDAIITATNQWIAVAAFMLSIAGSTGSLNVETAWNDFIESYSKSDPLSSAANKAFGEGSGDTLSLGISILLGAMGCSSESPDAGDVCNTVSSGIAAGAGAAALIYAYEIREEWYVDSI
jgi:RHS repeat-associated protein